MNIPNWLCTIVVSGTLCAAASAQVTGKVTLDGKAPEMKDIEMNVKECADQHPDPVKEETVVVSDKGELANVIVSVKKEEGMDLPGDVPKTPAVLDQKGCQYIPHVLPVMIGQELRVKNDDAFLHNVHALPTANPEFNFGQPNKDPGRKIDPLKIVETFKVKCDVHPWMTAWIRVFDHPYFAASKEDGTFSIAGVPDGEYTFIAWHEKLGEVEQKGSVAGGKATVDFKFKSAEAAAPAEDGAKVLLTEGKAPEAACGDSCIAKPGESGKVAESAAPAIKRAMVKSN